MNKKKYPNMVRVDEVMDELQMAIRVIQRFIDYARENDIVLIRRNTDPDSRSIVDYREIPVSETKMLDMVYRMYGVDYDEYAREVTHYTQETHK